MQNVKCDRYIVIVIRFFDTPQMEQVSLRSPLESPSNSQQKLNLDLVAAIMKPCAILYLLL